MRILVATLITILTATTVRGEQLIDIEAMKKLASGREAVVELEQRAELFVGIDSLESAGRVPNYLRAMAGVMPTAVAPFSRLVKTFIYAGAVEPETKLAMGLAISARHNAVYSALYLHRLLKYASGGEQVQRAYRDLTRFAPAQLAAVGYALTLSRDVNGVSEVEFAHLRGFYNDSQIVELTMAVSFFNYFIRYCEGLNLPVESWVLDESRPEVESLYNAPSARVTLLSDEELDAAIKAAESLKAQPSTLGFKSLANSQRAMLRAPLLARAWREYGTATREKFQIPRELQLHISFAVSKVNGCRYCILHQVLGLRKQGVEIRKLLAIEKNDEQLTARKLAAVRFARALTAKAASSPEYVKLKSEFTGSEAFSILLQTCNFNFMNRFTDALRLPSEDEAVQVYREVYGK